MEAEEHFRCCEMGLEMSRTGGLMMVRFLSSDLQANITRTTCGSSKLCVSSPDACNPAGNSSCFFSSTQFNNSALTVEITGTTSGYVALGLTPATNQTLALFQVAWLTHKHVSLADKFRNNKYVLNICTFLVFLYFAVNSVFIICVYFTVSRVWTIMQ